MNLWSDGDTQTGVSGTDTFTYVRYQNTSSYCEYLLDICWVPVGHMCTTPLFTHIYHQNF